MILETKGIEAPETTWTNTYGGISDDYGSFVTQTSDDGYVMAGATTSFGAGGADVWLIKTDAAGGHQWNQTYGGTNNEQGYSVVQTNDSGYALAGATSSFGAGGANVWLIKTDAAGGHQWNQTYGGTINDYGFSVLQTNDNGYALAGYTRSFGAGNADVFLVKVGSLSPSPTPSPTPTALPTPTPTPSPTASPTSTPTPTIQPSPTIPEFSTTIALISVIAIGTGMLIYFRKHKKYLTLSFFKKKMKKRDFFNFACTLFPFYFL